MWISQDQFVYILDTDIKNKIIDGRFFKYSRHAMRIVSVYQFTSMTTDQSGRSI